WYNAASFALLVYDYCLTFHGEVDEVWRRERKPGMIVYNALSTLSGSLIMVKIRCAHSSYLFYSAYRSRFLHRCNQFAIAEFVQTLVIVLPAETILVYRAHALTNRSIYVSLLLELVMLSQCCIVIYAVYKHDNHNVISLPNYDLEPFHIVCILSTEPALEISYLAVSIFFDVIVFLITVIRTLSLCTVLPRKGLSWTILRDGTLYFCVILSGNIIWMVLAICVRVR
ncbi:hypothetical protein BDQ12DRAFT_619019, partial [Crucibulum laeve]